MNPQMLLAKNQELTAENVELKQSNASLQSQVDQLSAQLDWLKRQLFGQKSEKIMDEEPNAIQLYIDGCDPESSSSGEQEDQPKPQSRRRSKGCESIKIPEDLPVQTQEIDIPEAEKVCPVTGNPLVRIGEEITNRLAYRPGAYFIKQIIRPKYATADKSIKTAPLPESLLDRCIADESLLADIIIKKYVDHQPIYRICSALSREHIEISRHTMTKWVMRAGRALKPLYDELVKQVLSSKNIFVDESPVSMLDPGSGKTHQSYMWTAVGGDPPYRSYHFRTSRQHRHAHELLEDYTGNLHSDKYGAYETLAKESRITWNPCYAHIRRKFFESSASPIRDKFLRKIRYLFMFERIAWTRSPSERVEIRQTKEVPIIDELIAIAKDLLYDTQLLPKSKLREAIGYFYSLVPHLKNYTQSAEARIDNNRAEQAIRPLALGRKNWLFVGSEQGGEVASVLLSLTQSCVACKVNPRTYLEDVMRRIQSHSAKKLHELLPDQWAKAQNLKSENENLRTWA